MTDLALPRSRAGEPGRHIDGGVFLKWLTRRLNPSAFFQWMLVGCLALVLWPATYGGAFGIVIVAGDSMEPTYSLGDSVITWRQPVEIGDTVSFRVPEGETGEGNPVIHRVIGGDASGWITQGDNSYAEDTWTPSSEDILGVAQFRVPFGGRLLGLMRSWLFIAVVGGVAAGLLLWPDSNDEAQPEKRRGRHRA
jgi:signal peptidase